MSDVQAVTMGLLVSVCLWEMIDFISVSNYLPVWEDASGERLPHALIMPPQLFNVQQVFAFNNLVHMAPGRGPQLCFDVEKANVN